MRTSFLPWRIRPYRSPRAYVNTHATAAATTADDIRPEMIHDWSSALPREYAIR